MLLCIPDYATVEIRNRGFTLEKSHHSRRNQVTEMIDFLTTKAETSASYPILELLLYQKIGSLQKILFEQQSYLLHDQSIIRIGLVSVYLYQLTQLRMLRRDKTLTDKINDIPTEQTPTEQRHKGKMASLAPYLAEIERRKKIRSIKQKSKKNLNQSSSKSFRIKEKSVTSLQKDLLNHTRDISTNNFIPRRNEDKVHRERKTRSVQRQHQIKFSKTIESKPTLTSKPNSDFFNDLYARIKGRIEKERQKGKQKPTETEKETQKAREKALRRKQFETLEQHRARSEQAGELNMYKISCTNVANISAQPRRQPSIDLNKKTENMPPKKGNFRRNKYEALHSSVTTSNMDAVNLNRQPLQHQSDSRIVLDKKQSNATINIQMDRLAQRQMCNFYQQVVNKQMHRSIEKSTQKYFNYQSYRPTKSKHDIEIYLSTFTNPSLQKVSKSTNQKSQKDKILSLNQVTVKNNQLLDYDFDFKNDQSNCPSKINQIDDALLQQSTFNLKNVKDEFQKQRKQVEIEHFNKVTPQLDWSEDDCKVDEI